LQPIRKKGELSSAGSEHLPYKQRVTGSNPVVPTKPRRNAGLFLLNFRKGIVTVNEQYKAIFTAWLFCIEILILKLQNSDAHIYEEHFPDN
jgi:hypothetical protein